MAQSPKPAATGAAGAPMLDLDIPIDRMQFLKLLRGARKLNRRSTFSIFREIMYFQYFNNRVTDTEYFKYRLFDDQKYTEQQKKEFVGQSKITKINRAINGASPFNQFLANKLYVEKLLAGFGVAGVTTLAIYGAPETFPFLGNVKKISTKDGLQRFLDSASTPLFAKPARSSLSLGTIAIASIDANATRLNLTNGETVTFENFHAQIHDNYYTTGYMLQDMIRMDSELAPYSPTAVGTFRIVTCQTPAGIRPLYCLWKIPGANSMADNFWRTDSLIANIDIDSGKITRCQQAKGLDAKEVDVHPDTDQPLVGLKIPKWEMIATAALNAAALFQQSRIIGFDIALSDTGPVIIEANSNPDHGLFQVASGKGFLHTAFAELVDWNTKEVKKNWTDIKRTDKQLLSAHKKKVVAQRLEDFRNDVGESAMTD
jgi:hypothetical protein